MTIREVIVRYLTAKGMSPEQAQKVLDIMVSNPLYELNERGNDDIDGYPEVFAAVIRRSADITALGWIVENKPQAWFRPMFEAALPDPRNETTRNLDDEADEDDVPTSRTREDAVNEG
ncbi:MAG: hypothetical protein IMZ71_01530 [Chloroflexi bacterium]|nr:hypothetical protein [Chloroflexota bacterium]